MCGIAGIIGFNNCTNNLKDMLVAMNHRGPDDRGIFVEERVALGHNRLSIIDLSQAGHQPMTSQNGNLTIVFNGEIYNYLELRELLPSNTVLRSSTDTEVILELWNIYGPDILAKLRGMFAFAIMDNNTKKLVLARDHMGIKPLYYWCESDKLVFASEIKGMLACGLIKRKICNDGLTQYLENGYVMQPKTIIEKVFMLPPASYLVLENNKFNILTFWKITDKLNHTPKTEQEAIQTVKSLLTDAVKEEMISDRPLGIFLSGGLDSTVILAALKNCGINNIRTFSVGFDEEELSEEVEAKETAIFYNTQHTQLQVEENDIIPHINQFILALDQPSVDGLNTWLVSKVTAKHVTVALSGLGGDELFSGYSIDKTILYKQKYIWVSKILYAIKFIWKYAPSSIKNRLNTYASWINLPSFYKTWGSVFNQHEINQLIGKTIENRNQFAKLNLSNKYSLLQRISYMHQRGFMMSRLLRDSDAVSMDHSIEVRFPIIDFRLVNLAFHLPNNWKLKFLKETAQLKNYEKQNSYEQNGVKHILYQAFKNDLPPQFGKRPKRGFKMPIEKWMKSGLLPDIEKTLSANDTLLSSNYLKSTLTNWKNGNIYWTKVWSVYILEKWVAQNLK
jgi:asparagine synthase (glutamine-hydrolysing)